MRIRDDLSRGELVRFDDVAWTPSPSAGVERKMLERDGGEVARATSIVRYGPRSAFAEHTHELGEEFIVLDGVFSDEHGDYPAGTYVRNPPGSRHRPSSMPGCAIFVKLRQFAPNDARPCVLPIHDHAAPRGTVEREPLHAFGPERVSIVRLGACASAALDAGAGGVELLVLQGSLTVGGETCPRWTWGRFPRLPDQVESPTGCVLWLKQGHLGAGL